MRGCYRDEEDDRFFESREEVSFVSDGGDSDCSESCSSSSVDPTNGILGYSEYEIWTKYPESVTERRSKFMNLMGFSLDQDFAVNAEDSEDDASCDKYHLSIDRITANSGAALRMTPDSQNEICMNQSFYSLQAYDASDSLENGCLEPNFVSANRNVDDGPDSGVASSRSVSFDELQGSSRSSSSSSGHGFLSRGENGARVLVDLTKKVKKGWLKKLGALAHIVERHRSAAMKTKDHEPTSDGTQRVKVHPHKKRSKELSSLYTGQEFVAHEGSILTMKFSLDGRYLASAGEDGTVRVWKVTEDEKSDRFALVSSDIDSSYLYFSIDHLSQLAKFDVDKEGIDKPTCLRTSDSTCVILPSKVFRILEKPLHEFQGHCSEVLDLTWSKNGFLLSSSVDKTVRLWQVGCDRCLRVFSHNNYVTCVAFNPVDDNYFISGSIDGKVRIWEVLRCKVVDYTDIREIVTAVCYRPDGKGGIVGTITGNCRFYDIIDNQLQQDAQICLQGKKKLPGKRITGFQFSPTDASKVIVTSADSVVRILSGTDVLCKFKASGFQVAGSQMSASFTADGKHIVSASEDSGVYIWNYTNHKDKTSRAKSIWSCESFFSHNVSVSVPWFGIEPTPATLPSPTFGGDAQRNSRENAQKHNLEGDSDKRLSHPSPDCFSLARGFLLEYMTKGAATWPEEKLPDASPRGMLPPICKSKLKLLKSACQSILSSPHLWGLVIVTAGWDGRIRTYLNYGLPIRI